MIFITLTLPVQVAAGALKNRMSVMISNMGNLLHCTRPRDNEPMEVVK